MDGYIPSLNEHLEGEPDAKAPTGGAEVGQSDSVPAKGSNVSSGPQDENTFTVGDAIENFGFGRFQIYISLFAGFSWMAESSEMMIMAILPSALVCEWNIKPWQKALISQSVFVGMIISSLLWGKFCDRFGRRLGIMLIGITTFIFGAVSALAPSFSIFLFLRMLTGLGIGGIPQSVTYYSEFLPMKNRAMCVVGMQIFWAFGGMLEAFLALFVMEPMGWRWLLFFSSIPMLMSAAFCSLVPETPRYLMTSGKQEQAYQQIEKIASVNRCVMLKGKLVEKTKEETNEERGKICDLFHAEVLCTTLLILPIWFIASFNYYGMVLYQTEVKESGDPCHGGVDNSTKNYCHPLKHGDYLELAFTSLAEFPGLLFAIFLLEVIGRRNAMISNFAIYCAFTLMMVFCLDNFWLTCLFFTARAFASGAFQCAYVFTPEAFPTTLRAVALGMASGSARTGSLLTSLVANMLTSYYVLFPVIIYAFSAIVAIVLAFFLPFETKGNNMTDRLGERALVADAQKAEIETGEINDPIKNKDQKQDI